MSPISLLEVNDYTLYTPQGRCLFQNLALSLRTHQILWIRGANGAGKSSLLRNLLHKRTSAIKWTVDRESIGYLPQLENTETHLPLTIRDVLTLALPPWEKPPLDLFFQSGLIGPNDLGVTWNSASGGERKKALLTRLFLQRKRVLLLDEPFNHLDKASRTLVQTALVRWLLRPDEGRALILVSHDPEMTSEIQALNPTEVWLKSP